MTLRATLVDDIEKVVNKGDIFPVTNESNGLLQLVICCPGCGVTSGSAGNHKYDAATMSYEPSIVHEPTLGGCGWHGWLKNGEFTW